MNDRGAPTYSTAAVAESNAPTLRLRISHLMLWTLCSAGYLAISRIVQQSQGAPPEPYVQVQNAQNLVNGVVLGGVLAGTFLLGWHRIRGGPPVLRQPGHWLLVAIAIAQTYLVASLFLLLRGGRGTQEMAVFWHVGAIRILPAAVYFHGAFRCSVERWKPVFAILGSLQVLPAISLIFLMATRDVWKWFSVISVVCQLGLMIVALWLIILAAIDLKAQKRRDWLHWLGVGAYVANANIWLLWLAGFWLP